MRPLDALTGLFGLAPDSARVGWLTQCDYAHRGLHSGVVVENSMSAFTEAIARGMGIECDVQATADGGAAVFHDWELDRLTAERGPLADRTLEQLRSVSLGEGTDRIASLPELLGLVHGRVPLLIEIKSRRERRVEPLCLAVRRDLKGYRGEAAVMSFDPRVASWFRRHAPHVVRGLVVTEERARTLSGAWRRHVALWHARPDFLAYDVRDLPSRFAAAQRRRGLPLLTWTVRNAALRKAAEQHADAAIVEAEGVAPPVAHS